jgi:hypothetical protein
MWPIAFQVNESSLNKKLKGNVFVCTLCSKDRTPSFHFQLMLQEERSKVSEVNLKVSGMSFRYTG